MLRSTQVARKQSYKPEAMTLSGKSSGFRFVYAQMA